MMALCNMFAPRWLSGGWWLVLLLWLTGPGAWAQAPVKAWDRTWGGNSVDNLYSLCQTVDGGCLVGGPSGSGATGDKTEPSRGGTDYWVVKLDAQGNKQWDRTVGGSGEDELTSVCQTVDGGYLLAGTSASALSGDKTQPGRGGKDFWLVKLDAQGTRQWDRTFGGALDDALTCIEPTADGGYLAGGWSHSDAGGDKSEPNRGPTPSAGSFDYWVVKLTGTGQKQWDRTLGGIQGDELRQARQAPDGGYLLGGTSLSGSSGNRTASSRGAGDFWLVKLTPAGAVQWDRAYGGSGTDSMMDLALTADGGCALAGWSTSPVSGEKTAPPQSSSTREDFWLVKVDGSGTKQWDRVLGGDNLDQAHSVAQTADGGYVLGGVSYSGVSGDKSAPSRGGADYWLVKLDATGAKQWDATYGGSTTDAGLVLRPTTDGGYVMGGYSYSPVSGDKTQPARGDSDFWLVKLAPAGGSVPNTVHVVGPGTYCPGLPITLVAVVSATPLAYWWSTGETTASIVVTQPGTYSVTATFGNGQTSTSQHTVRGVGALPTFALGPDTTLCEGERLRLQGPTGPDFTYRWSDGSTGATLWVREPGTYTLEVSTTCARQAVSRRIDVRSCVIIPNIITPNADRSNDFFAPTGLGAGPWALRVYNRWGREVYHTEAYENQWGGEGASGLYYYWLEHARSHIVYKGWLEVKR